MSKPKSYKVERNGAYVVKAAESPSSRVSSKAGSFPSTPSPSDKRIAKAVIRHKSRSLPLNAT